MAKKASASRSRYGIQLPPEIHQMSSDEALPLVAAASKGRALVSFSTGKDSVGTVLALRAAGFTDLHLYHMYIVPNLRVTETALTYYERLWGLRITRLPHPWLWSALRDGYFRPWHRLPLIERWDPPADLTFDDVAREVRRDLGWSKDVPHAVGIRMDDSIFRASTLKKTGVYQRNRNVIYPIFDWTRYRLRETLIATQTRLAPEYAFFGRSFSGDGIDYKFIKPLLDNYPDDFARICEWFPALPAEILRYEWYKERDAREFHTRTFAL